LSQIADGQALFSHHKTGVTLQFLGNEFEQRALAATIRSHQAHTTVIVDVPGEIVENHFCDVTNRNPVQVDGDHGVED